jgi:hypothetical protein
MCLNFKERKGNLWDTEIKGETKFRLVDESGWSRDPGGLSWHINPQNWG